MGSIAKSSYTTSFAFFEALWEAGITHVFVNLGSDHPSIIEAMVKGANEKKGEFPRILTCPNEMVALSMADGFARLTGKPQCVIVHVDVGTQGLAAAVHNASCGRAPVLIFAGLSPICCAVRVQIEHCARASEAETSKARMIRNVNFRNSFMCQSYFKRQIAGMKGSLGRKNPAYCSSFIPSIRMITILSSRSCALIFLLLIFSFELS